MKKNKKQPPKSPQAKAPPAPRPLPPAATAAEEPEEPVFLRKLDWSAFWTATVLTFLVYFFTLAPTVTMEDCGELATGSTHLGVPHPPGYPIWAIITWYFTKIFAFVHFRGQPNPSWAVALASAVFGALAAGFSAILVCRSGTDMLRSLKRTTEIIGTSFENVICWVSGVSASLIFAFSPVVWSQSVIVEAYSLNAFFLVLILFLAYTWMRRPSERLPVLAWAVIALGVAALLVMAGLVVFLVSRMPSYDFLTVGKYYVGYLLVGLVATGLMALVWRHRPQDRLLYLIAFVFGLGLTNYQVLLLLVISLVVVVMVKDTVLFRDFIAAAIPFLAVFFLVNAEAARD